MLSHYRQVFVVNAFTICFQSHLSRYLLCILSNTINNLLINCQHNKAATNNFIVDAFYRCFPSSLKMQKMAELKPLTLRSIKYIRYDLWQCGCGCRYSVASSEIKSIPNCIIWESELKIPSNHDQEKRKYASASLLF